MGNKQTNISYPCAKKLIKCVPLVDKCSWVTLAITFVVSSIFVFSETCLIIMVTTLGSSNQKHLIVLHCQLFFHHRLCLQGVSYFRLVDKEKWAELIDLSARYDDNSQKWTSAATQYMQGYYRLRHFRIKVLGHSTRTRILIRFRRGKSQFSPNQFQ